ncbi:MAG: hypothetical protein HN605_03645 [Thaumarchaeota archaeon]|jgi:hypothetical protein|nr:hypothetical protein [Nitrososphaerota archaeon]MBT4510539.1 hypothetical protein [Nitrososphaerota archaeon]MBT7359724.1 hypothetical protein [Nitrososphaerota archaeon]MBT7824275.1 hypothetical protein [Nitrososphaerota archaeon]|tara:strand:- start:46 stop:363 length:318 start_codon:yes stop_codon:yes gene_type:complete
MTNDHFKELIGEERFSIKPNQVCVLYLKYARSKIHVGCFVMKSKSGGFYFTALKRFDDYDGRNLWIGVIGKPHMYEISVSQVIKFYIPKKDLSLDACMKLVSRMK